MSSLSSWLASGCLLTTAVVVLQSGTATARPKSLDLEEYEGKDDIRGEPLLEEPASVNSLNAKSGSQYRWPDNTIYYLIKGRKKRSDYDLAVLESVGLDFRRWTCLTVTERPASKRTPSGDKIKKLIKLLDKSGCWSYVGFRNKKQPISLSSDGCMSKGTVTHEFLHAAGFYHEQSRADRDDYVDILWDNIVSSATRNFDKQSFSGVEDLSVGYDYGSVMHYGKTSFSKDKSNLDTIVPTQDPDASIGQRKGLSADDARKVNIYYGCDEQYFNLPAPMDDTPADPTSCTFDSDWCGWIQDHQVNKENATGEFEQFTDEFDFYRVRKSDPGPNDDHTTGKGYYIYADSDYPQTTGDRARIRSPVISGGGVFCVHIYFNKMGDVGVLSIYTQQVNEAERSLVGTVAGSGGGWNWLPFSFNSTDDFQVIYEATSGDDGAIALDDFEVVSGEC